MEAKLFLATVENSQLNFYWIEHNLRVCMLPGELGRPPACRPPSSLSSGCHQRVLVLSWEENNRPDQTVVERCKRELTLEMWEHVRSRGSCRLQGLGLCIYWQLLTRGRNIYYTGRGCFGELGFLPCLPYLVSVSSLLGLRPIWFDLALLWLCCGVLPG